MTMRIRAAVLALLLFTSPLRSGDWPQFRYDSGRTAAAPDPLPTELHLQWVRELPAPKPAFGGEHRLRFDASYEPVVLGQRIFVPSMVTDSVTALDTRSGEICWQFVADGPVRFAPVAWQGRIFFVSDDGYLYCVCGETGELVWRFRGLPADRQDRQVLGHGRLISLRPARGGPVLADGVIYFAAGIWLGEGIFVHALDAATGRVLWSNCDSSLLPEANLDHGVKSIAGLSPQGYLAVVGNQLVVPCGAQLPAFLDRHDGKLQPYTTGWGGRVGLPKGSWFVAGTGRYLIQSGDLYDLERPNDERFDDPNLPEYKSLLYPGGFARLQIDPTCQRELGEFRQPVLIPSAMYFGSMFEGVVGYDLTQPAIQERANIEVPSFRQQDKYPDKWQAKFPELFRILENLKVHILAGTRLYAGGPRTVAAVDLPRSQKPAGVSWRGRIEGTPTRMLAADGRLFVVTDAGTVYAFGGNASAEPIVHRRIEPQQKGTTDAWTGRVATLLEAVHAVDGYALVLGVGSGRLAEELVRQTQLSVIAVDPDPARVAAMRQRFQQTGLYGTRISVHLGDPLSYPFPPYLANLVVSEDPAVLGALGDAQTVQRLFHPLRPYGGAACLPVPAAQQSEIVASWQEVELAGADIRTSGESIVLTRRGPLPGADAWTHEGASAANPGGTDDRFLQPPLGLLWWDASLRWLRVPGGVVVRVAGGRVLVLADRVLALDAFTGRQLWDAVLPPTRHLPSGEMVVAEDAIYVPHAQTCLVLDPATGRQTFQIDVPADLQEVTRAGWSQVCVSGDFLVGAVGWQLLCVARRTGQVRWRVACQRGQLGLAIGGGKVFCAEVPGLDQAIGSSPKAEPRTRALDLDTGEVCWQIPRGSLVRYSEPHDLLITAAGINRGADGRLVRPLAGPSLLARDTLIFYDQDVLNTCDLTSGERLIDGLTWFRRGCTNLRAGSTMLTTRYGGNAAYVDMSTRQLTPLWNVRSGCQNNLIPADGILSIPNLTGGCACNYTPTSLALAPLAVIEP